MAIRKILDEIVGRTLDSGIYACTLLFNEDEADPGEYRARLFFCYDGVNDLTSASGVGLYAVSDNPCDRIYYDDWNGIFRRPFYDTSATTHDSSFNTEIVCEFSGDSLSHEIQLFNHLGNPVRLSGESMIDGRYGDGNIPVNVLVERRQSSVDVLSAEYDGSGKVTVVTRGPHGFSDGDAVTMSGFPRTDHSCGVNGERFNGTFRISVVSGTEFTYSTKFFGGFPDAVHRYDDCEQVVGTKWIVCEYLVDKQVLQGNSEALVVWPAHTFVEGDRVTLLGPGGIVARNARLDAPAPNSFVCRSSGIAITDEVTSVVYAPRTPVSDVPANYSSPAVPMRRGGGDETLVDNSSTATNESTPPFYPVRYGAFDLNSPASGGTASRDSIPVGSGKFCAISFMPPSSPDHSTGNQFVITVRVTGSTEVKTELCMFEIEGYGWSEASTADRVYASMSRVPIATATVESEPKSDTQTCNYDSADHTFTFRVPVSISDRWTTAGLPVSLAFSLYGRDGAEVELGIHTDDASTDSCFRIVLARRGDSGSTEPISVKVMPYMATPGDTVSVMSESSATFDSASDNYRICLAGETDPAKWVAISGNDGGALTFTMPSGYGGNVSLVVKEKPSSASWDSDRVFDCTDTVIIDVLAVTPRVMKLNERMKPGVVESKVSRSAVYNRDFGYVGFREITDENSLIQNLYSCLLTRKGERLFNPDFGTTIEERIFSLRTGGNPNEILKECLSALETYEPRIQLVYEQCNITDMGPNGIYLTLGVIVPGGNVQTINIPFKSRGRLV